MQCVALPGSGRQTSQLGFGCSGVMAAMGRRQSLRMLETAFEAGIRHFDVAPLYGYGAAEACVGEFAARHAGQVTITTKYGLTAPRRSGLLRSLRQLVHPALRRVPHLHRRLRQTTTAALTPDRLPFRKTLVRASLEQSLRALRTGFIDLFLLHEIQAADEVDPDLQNVLDAAQRDGKIGAYGSASERWRVPALHATWPWLCNVLEYDWRPEDLLPQTPAFRIQHRVFAEHMLDACALLRLPAEAKGRVPAQLLLRAALLSNPGGIVLFSSTDVAHIRSCAEAASRSDLDAPAGHLLAAMRAASAPVHPSQHRSTLASQPGARYPESRT